MAFCDRLKESRIKARLTQEQLTDQLGIAKSTLSGYESGNREPAVATIAKILDVLNIDANYLYQDESQSLTEMVVSLDDKALLNKYHFLDGHGKELVDLVLEKELDRCENTPPAAIINIEDRPGGAKRLVEYFRGASAGSGVFILGNEIVDHIEIPATPENRNVDYAIKVSGDSMEPDYHDGDTVLVSQKQEMKYGDVGIFVINGSAYIKEYGKSELISRNPDFDNINVSEYDNIVCMGKVIGKLDD